MPLPDNIRHAHPYFMYDEIRLQPEAVTRAIEGGAASQEVTALLRRSSRIFIVGNGTSFHAAEAAAQVMRQVSPEWNVRAVQAYEFVHERPVCRPGDVLFAVSHAGESRMAIEAVDAGRRLGIPTVAVTGFVDAPVGRAADLVLATGYGAELSWAHTVSYTTVIAALAAAALQTVTTQTARRLEEELDGLPDLMRAALDLEAAVVHLVPTVSGARSVWFVGAGADEVTAREAALKLIETSRQVAVGMELEQMLHGYLPALQGEDLIWEIAPRPHGGRGLDLARAAEIVGTPVVMQTDGDAASAGHASWLRVPGPLGAFGALVQIVPLQLLSYRVALARSLNPDLIGRGEPRYLRAAESYT